MDLKEHYDQLYTDSVRKIELDAYQVDNLIDSQMDNRFGVTLLLRPDDTVKREIRKFLNKIQNIEPQQYCYPDSDLHVTVMSVISCYNGFNLAQIQVEDYVKIIQQSINGLGRFDIEFRGVTASPSCLMVQGFFKDDTLNTIRTHLRNNFKNSGLEQSMDKRYTIQTAHATVFRLKEKLRHKAEFLQTVNEYRDYSFGTCSVNSLEFVLNDWYQRKEYVKTLHTFKLQ